MDKHKFTESEISAVYRAIAERRDMRHFTNKPIQFKTLTKLLHAAHQAGSVGLMQPWRFIRISNPALRQSIYQQVEVERKITAKALGERQDDFMKLKVEGIQECAELLIVAMPDKREKHLFGRRTLPEMDIASTACAIQNMWLAARAEGLGMGWVSLFDPDKLSALLKMPEGSQPIAILCLGHVKEFYSKPMLELENWAKARPLEDFVDENYWSG